MANNHQAHAPYNFVPLVQGDPMPGELVWHDRYHLDRHTGYFEVELETITPLFVRGMVSPGEEAKNQPMPFMLNGQPVIPGASLRGMIRNLVEIITFGKMHFVSNTLLLFRSVFGSDTLVGLYRSLVTVLVGEHHFIYPAPTLKGGYLVRDGASPSGWSIQPATEWNGESFVLVPRGSLQGALNIDIDPRAIPQAPPRTVWVQPAHRREYKNRVTLEVAEAAQVSTEPFTGGKKATLLFSQTVGRRHWYPAIFEKNSTASSLAIPQHLWDTYVDDRDMTRGIPTRKLVNEGDPLFYLTRNDGSLVFFGPTMFFRIPYDNSVSDLVPDSLKDSAFVDYTDAMFGYVSDDGQGKRDPVAYAGRVSVTSAVLVDGQGDDVVYGEEYTLKRTPGSPKPTTFQHYLEQPNGSRTLKRSLHHYGTSGARIRGHKLYWRQRVEKDVLRRNNSNSRNRDIETSFLPVKEHTRFSFRVYFENLTDAELGALAWVLTLDDDAKAYHMIGMGKPYGLGVVKLSPKLVETKREIRYSTLFTANGEWEQGTPPPDAPPPDLSPFIQAFKAAVQNHTRKAFDEHERIRQLKTMLRLYPVDAVFSYMELVEYPDRPVLPRPDEIV